MGLIADFQAGWAELTSSPLAFTQDAVSVGSVGFVTESNYVPTNIPPAAQQTALVEAQVAANEAAGKTNGSFVTGLNTFLLDPSGFFNTLFSGNANSLDAATVKNASTKTLGQNLLNLPWYMQVGLAIVVLVPVAYIVRSVK